MSTPHKIRRLPQQLINRIAAGEVIERPASIVRELIDNAIDAGARTITIHADAGGTALQVRDDGIGMNEADLDLCLERHATSKLATVEDERGDFLKQIFTLGFRGEALSSIAAISRVTLISRTKDAANGFQIAAHYGERSALEPTAAKLGTTVRVEDLFHALPARRKFLKSDRYELSLISDVVKKTALAWPHIGLTLSGVHAKPISYAAEQKLNVRLKQIMGEGFLKNSVEVFGDYNGLRLSGRIGLPTYHRSNTSDQFIFVNQRPVRDRVLAGAIRAAYADLIFRTRFPALVLFLSIPAEAVDVNVHPAKLEVRFRDAAAVRLLVVGALKKALAEVKHQVATPHHEKALAMMERNLAQQMPEMPEPPPSAPPAHRLEPPQSAEVYQKHMPVDQPQQESFTQSHPLGVARGQLHKTYIISQNADAIIIIDQHAAHERILHEGLKASFKNKAIETQALLVPEIVELAQDRIEHLLAHRETIAQLGFTLERYGDNAVLVRDIPTLCKGADCADIISALADDFATHESGVSLEKQLDQISGNIACHASIRAGQELSLAEMNALLRQMETTPHAGQCNHGRPTFIELKLSEVEKLFHRR